MGYTIFRHTHMPKKMINEGIDEGVINKNHYLSLWTEFWTVHSEVEAASSGAGGGGTWSNGHVDVIMKHGGIAETNADNHVTATHVSKWCWCYVVMLSDYVVFAVVADDDVVVVVVAGVVVVVVVVVVVFVVVVVVVVFCPG